MVLRLGVVAENAGGPSLWLIDDVDVAVVVDVAERRASADVLRRRSTGPTSVVDQPEPLSLEVAEQEGDLLVIDRLVEQLGGYRPRGRWS